MQCFRMEADFAIFNVEKFCLCVWNARMRKRRILLFSCLPVRTYVIIQLLKTVQLTCSQKLVASKMLTCIEPPHKISRVHFLFFKNIDEKSNIVAYI